LSENTIGINLTIVKKTTKNFFLLGWLTTKGGWDKNTWFCSNTANVFNIFSHKIKRNWISHQQSYYFLLWFMKSSVLINICWTFPKHNIPDKLVHGQLHWVMSIQGNEENQDKLFTRKPKIFVANRCWNVPTEDNTSTTIPTHYDGSQNFKGIVGYAHLK